MKLTVYTAIFGDYDTLKEPLFTHKNIKFVCFSDKKHDSKIWDVRVFPIVESDARRESRKYKILSHKYIGKGMSLWIDGSSQLLKNPIPYILLFLKNHDFILTKHWRNCVYDEAKRCISVGKGNPEKIREQVKRYQKENYPENNGLVDSTVIARRMTQKVINVENDWWNELKKGCVRDQVSFSYVAWKNKLQYGLFEYRKIIKRGGHK